ncbi:transglycosylase [Pseudonocardia yuanmonensis]|uniref:Transglycosylase n=1 Tax=Pseudonocardia yuanmonensis TaxID=1095914 RepID=A0ABP8WWN9_9PSEU
MTITGIISAIVVGLVIGALGRLVVPGRQPIPIWLTLLIGIVAAFVGGFIASALGYGNANGGFPWILLLIQVALAAVGVLVAANAYGRRRRGVMRR